MPCTVLLDGDITGPVILSLLFDGAGLGGDVAMTDSFVPCTDKRLMLIGYGALNAS